MIFLSPGVKTEEIDYSTYVGQLSTCIVGMVGEATKGPMNVPTLITSPTNFVQIFGQPLPWMYGPLGALEFLKHGNQLFYIRVEDGSAVKASLSFKDDLLVFTAKEKGTYGNDFCITIVPAPNYEDEKRYFLRVWRWDRVEEAFNVSFDPTKSNYINKISSYWLDIVYDPDKEWDNIYPMVNVVTTEGSVPEFLRAADKKWEACCETDAPGSQLAGGALTNGFMSLSFTTSVPVEVLSMRVVRSTLNPTNTNLAAQSPSDPYKYDPYTWVIGEAPGTISHSGNNQDFTLLFKHNIEHSSTAPSGAYSPEGEFEIAIVFKRANGVITEERFVYRFYADRVETWDSTVDDPVLMASLGVTDGDPKKQDGSGGFIGPTDSNWSTTAPIITPWQDLCVITPGPNVPFLILEDYIALNVAIPECLFGGLDGAPVRPEDIVGTSEGSRLGLTGLQHFIDIDQYDINILACPGFWHDIVAEAMIALCESRGDCFAVIDPPQSLTVQQVGDYHNGRLEGEYMPRKALNSSYAALYFPWVQIYDIYSQTKLWVPPSGVVCGQFAYSDEHGHPWFATAGLNRGILRSVLDLERPLNQGDRDYLYGNGNAINPLINYKKQGIVIWGQRTLQRKTSALDRINVRRLLNIVKKSVAATTDYVLFEQNDEFTWRQWVGMINPYLRSIKDSRGFYDYAIIMDETTVLDYHKDRNEMPGQIYIKPTKVAEFIPISFIITRSGAILAESSPGMSVGGTGDRKSVV